MLSHTDAVNIIVWCTCFFVTILIAVACGAGEK